MTTLASRRRKKALALRAQWAWQGGLCFYCDVETWFSSSHIMPEGNRLKTMATREHLIRTADGGLDTPDNVVMACQECNSTRGETPWEDYLEQKEALSRANCQDPDEGYGSDLPDCVTIRPDGETPNFRPRDAYFVGGKRKIKQKAAVLDFAEGGK